MSITKTYIETTDGKKFEKLTFGDTETWKQLPDNAQFPQPPTAPPIEVIDSMIVGSGKIRVAMHGNEKIFELYDYDQKSFRPMNRADEAALRQSEPAVNNFIARYSENSRFEEYLTKYKK